MYANLVGRAPWRRPASGRARKVDRVGPQPCLDRGVRVGGRDVRRYDEPVIIKFIRTSNKSLTTLEEQVIAATIENAMSIQVWGLMVTKQVKDRKTAVTVGLLAAREFAHRQYPGLDIDIMPDD